MSSHAIENAASLVGAFTAHRNRCDACRAVDLEKPATLAAACLEGSRMAKDLVVAARAAAREQQRLAAAAARKNRGRA